MVDGDLSKGRTAAEGLVSAKEFAMPGSKYPRFDREIVWVWQALMACTRHAPELWDVVDPDGDMFKMLITAQTCKWQQPCTR